MENEDKKDFAGKNGFTWWVGFIEDRKDPLKLGRCKVRCVGWHADDKMRLPTKDLPWAMPSLPVNNNITYTSKEGDMVFGFFVDGENAQELVMLGVMPGIPLRAADNQSAFNDPRTDEELVLAPRPPKTKTYNTDGTGIVVTEEPQANLNPLILDEPTTSRIARNDTDTISKTFIQERKDNVVKDVPTFNSTWSEPETKYNTSYPYNHVTQTESGHVFEIDDTPGAERLQKAHRNGSFEELYPDGDKVTKVTKDNYEIVMGDESVYIMGKCNITVQGDAEIYVKNNMYAKIDGNVEVDVKGNYNEKVAGTYNVTSSGNMDYVAPSSTDNSVIVKLPNIPIGDPKVYGQLFRTVGGSNNSVQISTGS